MTLTYSSLLPRIVNPPQSQAIVAGSNATFTVTATGSEPLSYQWFFAVTNAGSGNPINGATNFTLVVSNVTLDNAGYYQVVVSNLAGSVTSSNALLTVNVVAPTWVQEPGNVMVSPGGSAMLTASVAGSPATYQWYFNGVAISGATNQSYAMTSASATNAGWYTVTISNSAGSITSDPAILSVLELDVLAVLKLSGPVGTQYRIDVTPAVSDSPQWTTLTNIALPSSPYVYIDWGSSQAPRRFYRAMCLSTNVNPDPANLAWIPPGTFEMGSPTSEAERDSNEKQHTVTLTKGFYMSKYLVRQGDYLSVVGSNPSYFAPVNGYPLDTNLPVEQVSWNDATNYCAMLTQREQLAGRLPSEWVYRLPTESEWEYACRAGTTTAFYFGNAIREGMANFDSYQEYDSTNGTIRTNTAGVGHIGRTSLVWNYRANPWGLYDMCGNVFEWCQDWYDVYPTGTEIPAIDPVGPASGSRRVMRGGSWINYGRYCRSASRSRHAPDDQDGTVGFRPVLAPGQP